MFKIISRPPALAAPVTLVALGWAVLATGAWAQAAPGALVFSADQPRHYSTIGAPIETVSASRTVSGGDLDLRTDAGAEALRARVRLAARAACDAIDDAAPMASGDSANCYQSALASGVADAENTIRAARYVAKN